MFSIIWYINSSHFVLLKWCTPHHREGFGYLMLLPLSSDSLTYFVKEFNLKWFKWISDFSQLLLTITPWNLGRRGRRSGESWKFEAWGLLNYQLQFFPLLFRLEVSLFFLMQSRGSMLFFGKRKDMIFAKVKLRYK